jgi:hypothetical protein
LMQSSLMNLVTTMELLELALLENLHSQASKIRLC